MKKPKIAKCIFCKKDPKVFLNSYGWNWIYCAKVTCVSAPVCETKEEAISAWNKLMSGKKE